MKHKNVQGENTPSTKHVEITKSVWYISLKTQLSSDFQSYLCMAKVITKCQVRYQVFSSKLCGKRRNVNHVLPISMGKRRWKGDQVQYNFLPCSSFSSSPSWQFFSPSRSFSEDRHSPDKHENWLFRHLQFPSSDPSTQSNWPLHLCVLFTHCKLSHLNSFLLQLCPVENKIGIREISNNLKACCHPNYDKVL